MAGPNLDDYVDVAERILQFKEKHPDGSLQTVGWSVEDVAGKTFVVYQAAAYRDPSDVRPGHGVAWEPFPGPTAFTRDSELMNAETAAWGRAIVAVGIAANRKIASRQEIRARTEERLPPVNGKAATPALAQDIVDELVIAKKATGKNDEWVRSQLVAVGLSSVPAGKVTLATIRSLDEQQALRLLERFEAAVDVQDAAASVATELGE